MLGMKNMISMNSKQIRKIRANKFGFVFQFAHLVPFLTVEEQLLLMLDVSESKLKKHEQKIEINKMLKMVWKWITEEMLIRLHYLAGKNNELQLHGESSINLKYFLRMNQPQASIQKDLKMSMSLIRHLARTLNIATY